jgi:choline dehydrogenase
MLSGIGPAGHLLDNGIPCVLDLPGVGENLRDHPQNFVTASVFDKNTLDTKKPRLQVGLRYTAENSQNTDDMLMWMGSYAVSGDYREILPENARNLKTSSIGYGSTSQSDLIGIQITISLYFATSSGTVRLTKENPSEFPQVTLNLLDSQEDVEKMSHGVRLAHSIMKSEALSEIVKDVLTPSEDLLNDNHLLASWLRQNTTTGNHLTSSCSMGNRKNPMSVVDENCRTHGIGNLFIADASVMPNTVRANTNVTTMMIGEKLSDFLKESD